MRDWIFGGPQRHGKVHRILTIAIEAARRGQYVLILCAKQQIADDLARRAILMADTTVDGKKVYIGSGSIEFRVP